MILTVIAYYSTNIKARENSFMTVSAYKKTIKATETPKEIEKRVMSQVTARLERVCDLYDNSEDKKRSLNEDVRQAVQDNQVLWITFKSDLMSDGNELSDELKASLISLAHFVGKQSDLVMQGEGQIRPLVDVNRNIIVGLSGKNG